MSTVDPDSNLRPFLEMMAREGLSEAAQAAFARSYRLLAEGGNGMIAEESIEPVNALPRAEELPDGGEVGEWLARTVIIKLNGGLGTGMGLERAKSLLPVRGGRTFLDLIVTQLDWLEAQFGRRPRFLLMNSFSTSADTRAALVERHPHWGDPAQLELLQNKVPKVLAADLSPAQAPADQPDLGWCPPGHGDLYAALAGGGWLERLAADGVEFAFVSNSDNLGATPDPRLLRWFAESGAPFAMEVTRRTAADRKGGHLARRRADGRLILRESAQCDPQDEREFQNIEKYKYFNTNSLWINIPNLTKELKSQRGALPLPVIRNAKTLDPRDPASPAVLQLETAMGAAIECFEGAMAIEVPRSRFAPVKTCDDLLVLRSDACEVREDGSVGLVASRGGVPPEVALDKKLYRLVDGLDALTADGVPSLVDCERLDVNGDWVFSDAVSFQGKVVLENASQHKKRLPGGVYRNQTVSAGE